MDERAQGRGGNDSYCHTAMYRKRLGNVKEKVLKKLLSEGAFLDEVCTCVGQLAKHNEKCRHCRWWKFCIGGCRAMGFAITGDRLGEDKAKCLYFNEGYIEKTDTIFLGSGYIPIKSIKSLWREN